MLQLTTLSLFVTSTMLLIVACSSTANKSTIEEVRSDIREPIEGIWSGEFDIGGEGPYDFTAVHLDWRSVCNIV